MIDLAAAKDGTTSVCRLGPEDHPLVVTGAGEELPTAAPPDRVHTGKVVVHLSKFANLKYKTAVQLPLHLLQLQFYYRNRHLAEHFWYVGVFLELRIEDRC